MDEEVKEKTPLGGIVTLVDAKHIWEYIDDSAEAREQIAFADVIVLNKTDLVPSVDSRGSRSASVFQGMHMLFDGRPDRAWGAEEPRVNKLIFIGRSLDCELLNRGFRKCLA